MDGNLTTTAVEKDPPFLDLNPPHWAARSLAYILILLFATVAVFSLLIRVPESVSGPFVLVPVHGTDPVRASRSGIIAEVRVAEGQSVAKGEPLFVVRSTPVGDRSADMGALEAQVKGVEESLANLSREYESQRLAEEQESRKLKERSAYLGGTIDFKRKQLVLVKEVAGRYEALYGKGMVSWVEYAARQLEVNRAAVDLEQIETESKENRASLEKLRHESEARRVKHTEVDRSLKEEREKARIKVAALKRDLVHSESNQLSVPAPCAGTVLRLQVKRPGAVVQEGEVLCELACSGEGLQAELTVPQAGVGRIKPGQGVKLLYDAFPYQRYGVRHGAVRWVSPTSVTVANSSIFHAFVDIEDEAILVEGQPRPLKAGMRGTAKVVVGRRSLMAYAFEPLRQLKESLADAPQKGSTKQGSGGSKN